MVFDYLKFQNILDSFVQKFGGIYYIDVINNPDNFKDICEFLRISKVYMNKGEFFNKDYFSLANFNEFFYDKKESNDENTEKFEITEHIDDVVDVKFVFEKINDGKPWSDVEKASIHNFEHLLNSFSSISVLQNYLKYSQFHDLRFKNIGNIVMATQFLEHHINNGTIDNFGAAFFNIHHFSIVNRNYGEDNANIILQKFFANLKNTIEISQEPFFNPNGNGVVVTVGGDNGIVVFNKKYQIPVLNYLRSTDINCIINGKDEHAILSCHAGINYNLSEFNSVTEIFTSCIAALNTSKKMLNAKIVTYDEKFKAKIDNKIRIESIFSSAIKNEEFLVYYQPKVDLHDYSLKGAEALVRWVHDGKMIFPDQFIPVCESNNTIKYLDLYMLNHVCKDIAQWINEGRVVPQISINLSRASLAISNISDVIISIIDSYNIPHSTVQIELTESGSDQSNDDLRPLVVSLSEAGISMAVDDFGTGYSSLSLINELPWEILKIDKSILRGAHVEGSKEQKMFKSIISMAYELGLKCIVEGVETRDDIRIMKESKCYLAQGYYFNKPLPKEEFEEKLDYMVL